MQKTILSCCLLLTALGAKAQVNGGRSVFQFLSLAPSARITALGGAQIAVRDEDLSLAAANPAALNPMMDGRLAFHHNFFLADVQHGFAAYAHHLKKQNISVQGGIQYMGYGDIKRADEYGNVTGDVQVSETAFLVGAARPLTDRWSIGANLRLAFSSIDEYKANAVSADIGALYVDTARLFSFAILAKQVGTQMKTYNGNRESLPFDLQMAVSKRLRHLPFRLTVVAHHLHVWDIRYDDPNLEDEDVLLFGETQTQENKGSALVDNFFRHLIFNGEFLLGKSEALRIRLGYNHLRKRELSVNNYRSLAGFSAGVGIKMNRFRMDIGYGAYHLGGGVLHVGIGTNLKDFL